MSLKATLGAKRFVKHQRSYEQLESKSATPGTDTSAQGNPARHIDASEGGSAGTGEGFRTSDAANKETIIQGMKVKVITKIPERRRTVFKILLFLILCAAAVACVYRAPRAHPYISVQAATLCSAVGLCAVDLNVNYASLARGASIIIPLTSETYKPYARPDVALTRKIFRRPVLDAVPPSTILRSIVEPDHCWAFRGRQGHVSIRLSHEIYVKSIVVVHLPDKSTHAAPRRLRVWGLGSSTSQLYPLGRKSASQAQHMDYPKHISAVLDQELIALPLVDAVYDATLPETHQSFNVSDPYNLKTHTIVVDILDNWGDEAITCLYGLRVFGEL